MSKHKGNTLKGSVMLVFIEACIEDVKTFLNVALTGTVSYFTLKSEIAMWDPP